MEAIHRQAMPVASFSGRRELHELDGRNQLFCRAHSRRSPTSKRCQLYSLESCRKIPSWSAAAVKMAKAPTAAAVADAYQSGPAGAEQVMTDPPINLSCKNALTHYITGKKAAANINLDICRMSHLNSREP